jgi:hypothetical protein
MGQRVDHVSVLDLFFGWPTGQVWPNIVASLLTTVLAVGWSHRRLRKHFDRRHEQLAEHITATAADQPPRDGGTP